MATVAVEAGMRETTQPGDECRTFESTGLLTFTIETGSTLGTITIRDVPTENVSRTPKPIQA